MSLYNYISANEEVSKELNILSSWNLILNEASVKDDSETKSGFMKEDYIQKLNNTSNYKVVYKQVFPIDSIRKFINDYSDEPRFMYTKNVNGIRVQDYIHINGNLRYMNNDPEKFKVACIATAYVIEETEHSLSMSKLILECSKLLMLMNLSKLNNFAMYEVSDAIEYAFNNHSLDILNERSVYKLKCKKYVKKIKISSSEDIPITTMYIKYGYDIKYAYEHGFSKDFKEFIAKHPGSYTKKPSLKTIRRMINKFIPDYMSYRNTDNEDLDLNRFKPSEPVCVKKLDEKTKSDMLKKFKEDAEKFC